MCNTLLDRNVFTAGDLDCGEIYRRDEPTAEF
jgi:hypothetical protein